MTHDEAAFGVVEGYLERDPEWTLTQLGLKKGGDLYRKGGYVTAWYIPKPEDTDASR
jgi:hypothetical protein